MMRGRQYSLEEKTEVAQNLVVSGSQLKTSKITGVPQTTISDWVNKDVDFIQLCDVAKECWMQEFDAQVRTAATKAAEQLIDRIENGDPVINKDGNQIGRKPMSGKELALTTGIMADKSLTLQAVPKRNRRQTESEANERINSLLKHFQNIADMTSQEDSTEIINAPCRVLDIGK